MPGRAVAVRSWSVVAGFSLRRTRRRLKPAATDYDGSRASRHVHAGGRHRLAEGAAAAADGGLDGVAGVAGRLIPRPIGDDGGAGEARVRAEANQVDVAQQS